MDQFINIRGEKSSDLKKLFHHSAFVEANCRYSNFLQSNGRGGGDQLELEMFDNDFGRLTVNSCNCFCRQISGIMQSEMITLEILI